MAGKVVIDKSYLRARKASERKQAGEQLRESEERFRALIENSLDAVAILNGEGTIVYESPSAERILGYKPEELVGKNTLEFLHPDDVQNVINILDTITRNPEQAVSLEVQFPHKDGSWHLMETVSKNLLHDPKVNGIVVNYRDITERKRADEVLRESEEKFRRLVEEMNDGYCVIQGSTVAFANARLMEMFGYAPDEVVGRTLQELLPPEIVGELAKVHARRKRGETIPPQYETRLAMKDGSARPIEFGARIIEYAGKPAVSVVIRDITEREKAEEAIRDSEEKFRRLVEDMNDGYCVLQGSRVVFANARSAEMFGYEQGEVVGKTVQELLPPEIVDELSKVRAKRQRGETVPEQYVTTLASKDGTTRPVELGTRVMDYAGEPALSVVIRDISERKQAEEELRRSEEHFRSLIENAQDAIVILNGDGTIRYESPSMERMTGRKAVDRIGGNPLEFSHPDDITNMIEIFSQLLENKIASVRTELRLQRQDGSWRTFEVVGNNLLENPAVAGIVLNLHDITERKQAEEAVRSLNEELEQRVIERTTQLQAVNKELEAFAYSVSHDLRAPLRSIDGFSQVLLEDYAAKLDEEGKDSLHRVRSASQRMAELIDDILNLSRLTRGEMRRETVDLSALAQTIATELRQGQPERQVEFTITPGLVVTGDAHLLRAALENLLGNAWKFTRSRAPARIEFGCAESNGQSAYFVRDNGVGFDMAYADKLFGAFQRLHSPNEFEGTGIGLATVQRIIHRHGGDIWAESAVDRGATFYFTL